MISMVNYPVDLATDEILSLSIVAESLQRKIWIMLQGQQYNTISVDDLLLQLSVAQWNTPENGKINLIEEQQKIHTKLICKSTNLSACPTEQTF